MRRGTGSHTHGLMAEISFSIAAVTLERSCMFAIAVPVENTGVVRQLSKYVKNTYVLGIW